MRYTLPFISFILCLLITPLVREIARKTGRLDHPNGERWHKKATALLGGIAIFTGIVIPLFYIAELKSILPNLILTSHQRPLPSLYAVMLIGIASLFVLGLLDDFIHIKPHSKLVGQILVASFVTYLGYRLHWFTSMTLDTIVTIVWIVGITNAFNLIDNMDGLCAGVGLIGALMFAFLFMAQHPNACLVSLIIAGSLAGFLIYNFNPASIFMGDCGSLPIGFSMAMLGLAYPEIGANDHLSSIAVPIMILMVPIFDTTMVTVIRLLSGRKASVGGKDHTSHRLVLMGMTEKGAVILLYGIGFVTGLSAIFVSKNDTFTSPAVIIPVGLAILLMGIYLTQIRVYPEKELSLLRDRSFTPILIELTYKRQLLLVILDFCLIAFAYYLAYRLRFYGDEFENYFKVFLTTLPAVIACKFIAFFLAGVYRGIWRYMSSSDVFVHIKASLMATFFCLVAVTLIYRITDFSNEIFVIDWFLTIGFLLGTRGSFRMFVDTMKRKTISGQNVLIYGAGRGGEILMREIINNKRLNLKPVGFIDDNVLKIGKKLQGYPVLGNSAELETIIEKYEVQGLLISFNHKGPVHLEDIKKICNSRGISIKRFAINLNDVNAEK